uniref:Uncharacterized protein n=1 Tax=Laticauda laticaudata TaxID=8630 RepID=A0A8C5WP52_LATLA
MISSHKMLKIKWFLTTKQNQNHPILEWIPMKLALHSSKTNDYIHNLVLKTSLAGPVKCLALPFASYTYINSHIR